MIAVDSSLLLNCFIDELNRSFCMIKLFCGDVGAELDCFVNEFCFDANFDCDEPPNKTSAVSNSSGSIETKRPM